MVSEVADYTVYRFVIAVAVLGSLFLLISSLRSSKQHPRSRPRRIAAAAGGLVLLWVACRFYWHSYDLYAHSYWGLFRPSSVALAFYFGWRSLTGATAAMLAFVAFPRSAKTVLGIAVGLFIASIVARMTHIVPTMLGFTSIAWAIGLAIPSLVLIWLEANEKKQAPHGF